MGYAPGPLEDLFVGEVTGVEASFPSGGAPSMTLVAPPFVVGAAVVRAHCGVIAGANLTSHA